LNGSQNKERPRPYAYVKLKDRKSSLSVKKTTTTLCGIRETAATRCGIRERATKRNFVLWLFLNNHDAG